MKTERLPQTLQREMFDFGGPLLWLCFRCLPVLLLAGISLLLLVSTTVRAESTLNDAETGQLYLQGDAPGYQPAVLHGSSMSVDASGMIAVVTLKQVFSNPSDQWRKGVYAFPLPDDAAVRAMEMRIGERRIIGEIRERKEAQKAYKKARESGRKASLVEQQRPNLFTNRVANIGPGEEIEVTLEYVQPIAYRDGVFALRLPTTITARYIPGGALTEPALDDDTPMTVLPAHGWARATSQVPDAADITPVQHPQPGADGAPHNPVVIDVRLDPGVPLAGVESLYHDVALSRSGGVYTITLATGKAEMDRDYVLEWRPATGSKPAAALFTEQVDGQYFGLLMVVPPALERVSPATPREMIFVVDTSGSMGGVSIRQARESLHEALRMLRPEDTFNIIAFSSDYRSLYPRAVPASRHHLQQAQEFVRHLDANGGTEMLPALRAALQPIGEPDEFTPHASLRQVVFITDGAVGNEEALFAEIQHLLGPSRLFTVGIGAAPNSWFMRKAAEFGRGTFTFVGDVGQVSEKMTALFRELSSPVAVDLAVSLPEGADMWPQRLPDLYRGEPLLIAVNFGTQLPADDVIVSGTIAGQAWQRQLGFGGADPQQIAQHEGVASLWARRKIEGLLDDKVRGADPDTIRAAVLPLALAHQLLSPYTSFLAVEQPISRPAESPLRSHPVPNSRPQGQTSQPSAAAQTYAYPRGATTGPAKLWFGALLMFVALLVRAVRGEGADA
ncbi:marine proteobacterial sortase target protein [Halioglobus japonicus]|uniref:Marine proteobacterial sortase target protein n=1 Tax=Halioglobus japonicus TaxID=930805 RepID=A0AAP8SPH9_9GAMM|nr:marine proteobacterial sortase target protein [Halioglobus japonicus]PLW87524.1 marine proteobacterial sortase target protein [Halioglobus japonicus]GHD08017.1 marine proteobacterial sortase target protein [Halioglobus japonicus]